MNLWPILLVFVLFFLNIPVAFSMIISALVYFVFMCEGVPMDVMTQSLLSTSESFTMLAVPFFITAGCIMGFLLSLALRGPLQESIRANLGESGNDGCLSFLGMAGTCFCSFLSYSSSDGS